ncbi:hypothetical protein [Mesorhizobium retamae]|uniref:Uncharacterized protein n=1 Tax=Mesorhizobium retamae TaxID=2912854 RepID=A0ABS9QNZ2_9HYPH|nr:hypothetical protein [Mesorhizobium sp. IRAMC:0171]MCG7509040.1 hypothetical protein [Mesorhizobium sp. IRAMC:0171]
MSATLKDDDLAPGVEGSNEGLETTCRVACAAGAFAALKIAPLAVAYLGGNYIGETIFAGQPTLTFAGQVAGCEAVVSC